MRPSISSLLPLVVIFPVLEGTLDLRATSAQLILTASGDACSKLIWAAHRSAPANLVPLFRLLTYAHFDFAPYWGLFGEESRDNDLDEASALIKRIIAVGGQTVLRWLMPMAAIQRTPFGIELVLRHLSTDDLSMDYPLDELNISSLIPSHIAALLPLLRRRSMATFESVAACNHMLSFGNLRLLEADDLWSLIDADCIRRAVSRSSWFQQQHFRLVKVLEGGVRSGGPLADLALYRLVALATWTRDSKVQLVYTESLNALEETFGALQKQVLAFFAQDQDPDVRHKAFMYIYEHMPVTANLQSVFVLEHLLMALHLSMPVEGITLVLRDVFAKFEPHQVPASLLRAVLGKLDPKVYTSQVATDLSSSWATINALPRRAAAYFPETYLDPEGRLDCWRRRTLRLWAVDHVDGVPRSLAEQYPTNLLGEDDAQTEMAAATVVESEGRIVVAHLDGTLRLDCSQEHRAHLISWWRGRLLRLLINLEPLPNIGAALRKGLGAARSTGSPPPLTATDIEDICIHPEDTNKRPTIDELSQLVCDLSSVGRSWLGIINA